MYHTINEFLEDWKTESEATLKVFKNVTDESLNTAIPNYRRTIGKLAWHITGAIGETMKAAGSPIDAVEESYEQPNTISKIIEEYEKASNNMAAKIKSEWTDASLKEEVNMFGEMWTKEFALKVIVTHQIHHRSQMTVLMRQAGLKVPGIYGPSYEEWQQYGMEAAK
jgi:uncharacterized damage-inducible protein DinB